MAGSVAQGPGTFAMPATSRRYRIISLLRDLRPTSLWSIVLKLLGRRDIVAVEGMRLFIDPTTHLGFTICRDGTYEPETIALIREHLHAGNTFLDIGANEGFFAALAATIVGPAGTVLAVEPQSRLMDVLAINLALNASGRTQVFKRVAGDVDDASVAITLFPGSNTGATSVVNKYAFGARTEQVHTITPATLLRQAGVGHVDLVKIDVEGFEPEVVRALEPLLAERRLGHVLCDYHARILEARGIDPQGVHATFERHGYAALTGTVTGGYVLYAASAG